MTQDNIRQYTADARSTDTFGRVLASCRNHHFIVDGPVQNGCPGEALTPPELFLSGVATCGVELVGVIARHQGIPLGGVRVRIAGTIDRGNPVRADLTVFNEIRLKFELQGVDDAQAAALVEAFKRR